jgi:hypothetical protein
VKNVCSEMPTRLSGFLVAFVAGVCDPGIERPASQRLATKTREVNNMSPACSRLPNRRASSRSVVQSRDGEAEYLSSDRPASENWRAVTAPCPSFQS